LTLSATGAPAVLGRRQNDIGGCCDTGDNAAVGRNGRSTAEGNQDGACAEERSRKHLLHIFSPFLKAFRTVFSVFCSLTAATKFSEATARVNNARGRRTLDAPFKPAGSLFDPMSAGN
jgi:hypothetical protein